MIELKKYFEETNQDKVSRYFVTRKYMFLKKYLKGKTGIALDIGCAGGLYSRLLNDLGFETYGVDTNEKFLDIAKRNSKVNYILADAKNLPFRDNNFDVIIMLATLEHITERENTLKEINRVLKQNGILILTVPNTWSYYYIRSLGTFAIRRLLKIGKIPAWRNVHYKQNYFYWEHLLYLHLNIIDSRPILSIPFAEPKLISEKAFNEFEYNKKKLAWCSAEPIFICTKRTKEPIDTDFTILGNK